MPNLPPTRAELVWPGKYDDDGNPVAPRRVNLPFQVIERVNETRAARKQQKEKLAGHVATLFDYWQASEAQTADPGDDWRNKLIWGDNLYIMGSLLEHFAGQIDLIYIDPPFATGADFSFKADIGDAEVRKEQSILEEKAYRDTWGRGIDSYLQMLYERLVLMRDLLADTGSIYLHVGPNVAHYVRMLMDEVFGPNNYLNDIVWQRFNFHADAKKYGAVHEYVLFYSKNGDAYVFNKQFAPFKESYIQSHFTGRDPDGRVFRLDNATAPGHGKTGKPMRFGDKILTPPPGTMWRWNQENIDKLYADGKIVFTSEGSRPAVKRYLDELPGTAVHSLWTDVNPINSQSKERAGYDTQKPESLLERVVKASSNEGDLIADFFCGSGTTPAVAEKLGRRWIGCDLGRYAIHTTRKRLMDIPNCKPFEVLNLGKYERQVWQGVAFGGQKQPQSMLIFEYLKFILDLYGAQPLPGTQHLHGKKGQAVVHVGAVDAPVTIDEISACLEECQAMGQKELHVLGWEWEMGLANLMVDEAKGRGVRLLMLHIPREVMEQQAVDKGDIHFYELAYLEADIQVKSPKTSEVLETSEVCRVTVELTDFVIPNDELIPPDVRRKIKKWSDYVDYWAVDWNFQRDAFVNGWTAYRTRQERSLTLKTEPHEYDAPGVYRILVKVIDIFGNDTSQMFEVEVS